MFSKKKLFSRIIASALICSFIIPANPIQTFTSYAQTKVTRKYYNTKKKITFADKYGFKKITVNGKKIKKAVNKKKVKIAFTKEGKYKVILLNKKNKKRKKISPWQL